MSDTLEEIGDFHWSSDGCETAIEYYDSALRALGHSVPYDAVVEGRLHRKIAECYRSRGSLQEALQFLDRAQEILRDQDATIEIAVAHTARARLLTQLADWTGALEQANAALELLKPTSAHAECALAQAIAALCHGRLGNQEEFEELSADALATYRRIDDVGGMAMLNNNLGIAYKNACRWDKAVECLQTSLELNERIGRGRGLARVLTNLGNVYAKMHRFEEALIHLHRARRLSRTLGDHATLTSCLNSLGRTEILNGCHANAEKHLRRAAALAERHQFARSSALADEFMGDLRQAQGRFEAAQTHYTSGLRKARLLAPEGDVVGEILRRMAELQLKQGLRSQAISTSRRALRVCSACDEIYELGYIHRTLGRAQMGLGKRQEGLQAFQTAIQCFADANITTELATTRLDLAMEWSKEADSESQQAAVRNAQLASDAFRRLEDETSWCRAGLVVAEAQAKLGKHDDALLVLCEVEQVCAEDETLQERVRPLRRKIESDLVAQATGDAHRMNLLGSFTGLQDADEGHPEALSFLQALCTRTRARCGFLAVRSRPGVAATSTGTAWGIRAAFGITPDEARRLVAFFDDLDEPRIFSASDEGFRASFADVARRTPGVLVHPLLFESTPIGILYLERNRILHSLFSREELVLSTTYANLAAEMLGEVVREDLGRHDSSETGALRPGDGLLADIITQDQALYGILGLVQKVAPSHCTVLLSGETGTGKGLIAQRLHELSARAGKFVAINCAAMPESLLESELFGHEQGAFTGADRRRVGLLEEADTGTVFLDEIGKTSLAMQGKLLHFLDTASIRPVGSNTHRHVDVRIVCASKVELKTLVERGEFLEDLYYRLSDFPLEIPPLRHRQGDVRLLAEHFLQRSQAELKKKSKGISRRAMRLLQSYHWPGNVRELSNCIKRAVVLVDAGQTITARHLTDAVQSSITTGSEAAEQQLGLREQLSRFEARLIRAALRKAAGNKAEAARILRISYPTLHQKLKLHREDPASEPTAGEGRRDDTATAAQPRRPIRH
jgi:transcriptional regulator with GAF, ATPase, and Fis domain/tetratricopeptide (TPR) repeat protein